MTDPANAYRDQSVTTASPAQLIVMLFDAALAAIGRARAADEQSPPVMSAVHGELCRAQDIATELRLSLDRDQGGDIAANLDQLYRYCEERLVLANVRKDLSYVDVVETTLGGLREAWAEMASAAVAS